MVDHTGEHDRFCIEAGGCSFEKRGVCNMARDTRGRGRFESLEQRDLLAGDVLVNVVGGNLMVQGDALDIRS